MLHRVRSAQLGEFRVRNPAKAAFLDGVILPILIGLLIR